MHTQPHMYSPPPHPLMRLFLWIVRKAAKIICYVLDKILGFLIIAAFLVACFWVLQLLWPQRMQFATQFVQQIGQECAIYSPQTGWHLPVSIAASQPTISEEAKVERIIAEARLQEAQTAGFYAQVAKPLYPVIDALRHQPNIVSIIARFDQAKVGEGGAGAIADLAGVLSSGNQRAINAALESLALIGTQESFALLKSYYAAHPPKAEQ